MTSISKKIKKISKFKNGFTIMEIIVATTIFVLVVSALLSLFNYIFKINRRSEALRQATQGVRNFVEFMAKEIRNGQIDYYVLPGGSPSYVGKLNSSPTSPCGPPTSNLSKIPDTTPTYSDKENKIGIISEEGMQLCLYFAKEDLSPVAPNVFVAPSNAKYNLVIEKTGVFDATTKQSSQQLLNPKNMNIESLIFFIRPRVDPHIISSKLQPFVTIALKAKVLLSTGEAQEIFYQTSVSTNKYDLP